MDEGTKDPPFSLQATGKNRTGRSTKSPLATLLARVPLEEARVQALALEYEGVDAVRRQQILNELTEGTVRFAIDLLTRGGKSLPEDVVSHLLFAHTNALGLYDPKKGKYLTYLSRWIRRELAEVTQDSTERYGVHIPVYLRGRERQVERARSSAASLTGREPTPAETQAEAIRLGLKVGDFAPDEIVQIRETSHLWATSFDKPVAVSSGRGEGEERTLHHFIPSAGLSPDQEAEIRALFPRLVAVEARMRAYLVRRFGERTIEVIMRRVFRRDGFREIAGDLILCYSRVRQIYHRNIHLVLEAVGLNLPELDRWYEALQQCERFLHREGALVWECREANEPLPLGLQETVRPIQEILDSVERTLETVHVVPPREETRVHFPPHLTTLQQLQVEQLEAGMVPPRFTLKAVYEVLWELSVELGPQNWVRRMMTSDPTPLIKERLGISRLYAFLAIHEFIRRGLLQLRSPKRTGGKVRFCGPPPSELRLEGEDPFDVPPPIVPAAIRSRILYLLPDEYAVWSELSRRCEEHRCISTQPSHGLDASVWERVVQSLLRAGILAREGECLVFLVPTSHLTVIAFRERGLCYLPPMRFALLRAIQSEFTPSQKGGALRQQLEDFSLAWANEHGEDPIELLRGYWSLGGNPLEGSKGVAGVIRFFPTPGTYAISVEGLEAFTFVSEDRIARRQRKRLLARAALPSVPDHQEPALDGG